MMNTKEKLISLLINIALFSSSPAIAESITSPLTVGDGEVKNLVSGDTITINATNGVMVDGGKLNLTDVVGNFSDMKNINYGLSVKNAGEINVIGGEYTFSGTNFYGFQAKEGGQITITGSKITSGDVHAYVIDLDKANSTAIIQNSQITSTHGSLFKVNDGAKLSVTDSKLTVGGSGTGTFYSVTVQGPDAEFIGERLEVISNANYDWTSGLFLVNNNKLTLKDSSIASNFGQVMLYASRGTIYGDGLTMNYKSQSSDNAKGNIALRVSDGGTLDLKNSLLNVSGDNAAVGVYIHSGSQMLADNLIYNANDNIQAMQIKDSDSSAIFNNSQITVADATYAVRFVNGALASTANASSLTLDNSRLTAKQWALNAYNGGAIVNVSGANSYVGGDVGAIYIMGSAADADMAFNLSDNGQLNGDVFVVDENGFNATLDMNLSTDSAWTGNVLTYDQNSTVNVNLQSGANWSGAVATGALAPSVGTVNLSIDAANWDMTADSTLNTLTLANQGSVTLGAGTASGYQTLTVGDLSGSGVFTLRTDLVGDGSGHNGGDLLKVTGTTSGTHELQVLNNGSAVTNGSEILTVVETADGNGSFSLGNRVELGGYLYDISQNGTNWQLAASGSANPDPSLSEGSKAPLKAARAGYLLSMAETQTLLQRMGDLRSGESNGNVWLRGFAGGFNNKMSERIDGFDMTYSGTQLGADKRFSVLGGDVYLGAMTGLTRAEQDYSSGDGTVRNYHFGLYGTYLHQSGFYVDSLIKYSDMKYKFAVNDTAGNRVSADESSAHYSASLEVGQRFHFNAERQGIYLEPQLQLTYGYQDSTDFNESNGLRVEVDNYTSLLGRAGLNFGYELKHADMPVNIYARASYIKEFDGDVNYRLNGSKESESFKDKWWSFGVGVTAQVAKQHALYIDMEQANGGKFDQYQVNGGYRFSF